LIGGALGLQDNWWGWLIAGAGLYGMYLVYGDRGPNEKPVRSVTPSVKPNIRRTSESDQRSELLKRVQFAASELTWLDYQTTKPDHILCDPWGWANGRIWAEHRSCGRKISFGFTITNPKNERFDVVALKISEIFRVTFQLDGAQDTTNPKERMVFWSRTVPEDSGQATFFAQSVAENLTELLHQLNDLGIRA